MAEYIEREEALDRALYTLIKSSGPVDKKHVDAWTDGAVDAQDCIYESIAKIPAADVAPVVHGEWDTTDSLLGWCCICSVCSSCSTMEYRYCPYCGAKMDGGKRDGTA